MKMKLPKETGNAIRLNKLYQLDQNWKSAEGLAARMVKSAAVLAEKEFLGWQMYVPKKGTIEMSVFGSAGIQKGDLEWISERCANTSPAKLSEHMDRSMDRLYELKLPVSAERDSIIGFGSRLADSDCEETEVKWPMKASGQFSELVAGLQCIGGTYRVVCGPASKEQKETCYKEVRKTLYASPNDINTYVGKPIQCRCLLRLAAEPSIRLKAVLAEAIPDAELVFLGIAGNQEVDRIWDEPLNNARTLPNIAARIMVMEPILKENIIGIETCKEEVTGIPAAYDIMNTKGAVTIGQAVTTAGTRKNVTISEMDLKRHYQIIGQTGTGKSTLLANTILSAIEQGHGLTFFDPHGSTIDLILRAVPEKYADRIRVVRIGDADNPVPLNIWDSGDPDKEERTISDLCELFADIFDPKKEGIVGPRYERWLSTFAKASLACLGRRASLESIAVLSQSKDNMLNVYKKLHHDYPELADIIRQEYGTDNSNDFHSMLNWYLCKFQKLTSVEQLRKTFGAGGNALNFKKSIDTNMVTLIDLASPKIGTNAARIAGTLIMMKLWNAALERKKRERLHMIVVDEASLFQTNPMPRILAEGRKFGISMVLCHQHSDQLSPVIRDALEANSANLSAFRLSAKDARSAMIRFDDPEMLVYLTRQNAFQAVTSLSVNGIQTEPFTLEIKKPTLQKDGKKIASKIEWNSIETLIEPYRNMKALTAREILNMIKAPN